MSPESTTPVSRLDAPWALLVAALGLSALEAAYAWAERWFHAPEYFALSIGLTLALALAVALPSALLRLHAGLALALWIGLGLWASWGWQNGLAALLVCGLAARTPAARGTRPALLGAFAALALACAYLKCSSFAEHLGRKDDFVFESVGATLILAVAMTGLPFVLRRLPLKAGTAWKVVGLLLAGSLLALRPRLERGDGRHRLPPADYSGSPERGAAERPNVFVLVLDTVRADHLTLYGYERNTTPELDRLVQTRKNSAVFPRAFSNGTWTVPSHASLFTGRLPNEHGAHFSLDGKVRVGFGINEALPTLAGQMKAGGYATLAGYANHWLRSVRGMGRGFERYLRAPDRDELPFVGEALRQRFLPGLMWEAAKGCARAPEVNATLLSMVKPWSRGPNPLFVFANYVDAHGPYAPPLPFRGSFSPWSREERSEHLDLEQSLERRAQMMARYDEEIAYLDGEIGRLFHELEQLGILADSWVFITSDHGEAFGEHAVLEHGTTVFNEVVHVPLIVFPPEGVRLPVTNDPVSLVDVAATVAAIGGVELPGPGRDLRQAGGSVRGGTVLEFYGDAVKAASLGALARRPARSVLVGQYKLIAYSDSLQLFDLDKDPGENIDLARAFPELVAELEALLPDFESPTFASDGDAPTPESLDALRGMGYLGGP